MEKKLMKNNRISPEEELNRCVWMTAGVISFKLCPFDFDCERCEFDRVMRLHVSPTAKPKIRRISKTPSRIESVHANNSEEPFFTFTAGEVDERFYVHPTHLWAKREYDHTWKVGIDNLLAYILPPPVKVELYRPNQEIIQQEVFGRILTEAGTVFVTAPLSGRLVQANPRLTQEPDLVQSDPWGEGWLAIIDWLQDGIELERLHAGSKAAHFLNEEAQHLKILLRYRGISVNPVGHTMPDGGAEIKYLHQILSPKVCLNLARELIVTGKEVW